MKSVLLTLFAGFSSAVVAQTITIPATNLPYNPATNTIMVPAIPMNVTPAATPAPISRAALRALRLDIVSVEYKSGIHEVTGYDTAGALVTRRVLLGQHGVLPVSYFIRPKFSIVTVPFKVRGAIDTIPAAAQAGLTNIGLCYNFFNYRLDRYFSTGTKSTHTLSAGVFFAPTVEDVSPETTRNKVAKKSSQLFLSTGLSLTYSYGDVSFLVVPIGFDFATTNSGKNHIYNGRYWWGFGLGLNLKLFGII